MKQDKNVLTENSLGNNLSKRKVKSKSKLSK